MSESSINSESSEYEVYESNDEIAEEVTEKIQQKTTIEKEVINEDLLKDTNDEDEEFKRRQEERKKRYEEEERLKKEQEEEMKEKERLRRLALIVDLDTYEEEIISIEIIDIIYSDEKVKLKDEIKYQEPYGYVFDYEEYRRYHPIDDQFFRRQSIMNEFKTFVHEQENWIEKNIRLEKYLRENEVISIKIIDIIHEIERSHRPDYFYDYQKYRENNQVDLEDLELKKKILDFKKFVSELDDKLERPLDQNYEEIKIYEVIDIYEEIKFSSKDNYYFDYDKYRENQGMQQSTVTEQINDETNSENSSVDSKMVKSFFVDLNKYEEILIYQYVQGGEALAIFVDQPVNILNQIKLSKLPPFFDYEEYRRHHPLSSSFYKRDIDQQDISSEMIDNKNKKSNRKINSEMSQSQNEKSFDSQMIRNLDKNNVIDIDQDLTESSLLSGNLEDASVGKQIAYVGGSFASIITVAIFVSLLAQPNIPVSIPKIDLMKNLNLNIDLSNLKVESEGLIEQRNEIGEIVFKKPNYDENTEDMFQNQQVPTEMINVNAEVNQKENKEKLDLKSRNDIRKAGNFGKSLDQGYSKHYQKQKDESVSEGDDIFGNADKEVPNQKNINSNKSELQKIEEDGSQEDDSQLNPLQNQETDKQVDKEKMKSSELKQDKESRSSQESNEENIQKENNLGGGSDELMEKENTDQQQSGQNIQLKNDQVETKQIDEKNKEIQENQINQSKQATEQVVEDKESNVFEQVGNNGLEEDNEEKLDDIYEAKRVSGSNFTNNKDELDFDKNEYKHMPKLAVSNDQSKLNYQTKSEETSSKQSIETSSEKNQQQTSSSTQQNQIHKEVIPLSTGHNEQLFDQRKLNSSLEDKFIKLMKKSENTPSIL